MKRSILGIVVLVVLTAGMAQAVTIDMVSVGNQGNAGEQSALIYGDTNYYGSVDHSYAIGKYEVTAGQYSEFLNAKAKSDPEGLYNTSMSDPVNYAGCNIQRSGSSGSYAYSVATDWANRPVNYVSFWDAARFTNWLHNGQGNGDTETGAYTLTADGIQTNTITKNSDAQWWVPSENEWYKAAYHKNDGITGNYFDYPTSSDMIPSNVLGVPIDPGNNATFHDGGYTIGSPYYRTKVGEHENSDSPYGTFDQGGNVFEWNDTIIDSTRGVRGGAFSHPGYYLASSSRGNNGSKYEDVQIGFRVASLIPPNSWKGPGGGNYDLASNWTDSTVPNAVDATANFLGNITAPSQITLNSDVTLGTIKFNSSKPYILIGTSNLILQTSNGEANINVQTGIHRINVPVVLNSDAIISGAGNLVLNGGISGNHTLTILGTLTATSIQVDSLNIGTTGTMAVPEPSTLAMLTIALGSLLWWRRRV